MDEKNFYNKVADRFGNYDSGVKPTKEFPDGQDPEAIFKAKLLELSSPDKTVLDVGCADGRFTLSIAPNFGKIVAVDVSDGMLDAARRNQTDAGITNVEFVNADAHRMSFADGSFDVIYSRRGPTEYPAYSKLLKPGGYFVEIEIGEKDTQRIKEVFGRGQNFGEWNDSQLAKETEALTSAGFHIDFPGDYVYAEFYASFDDLSKFLQSVPIFEDFDPGNDRANLERYVSEMQTDKGINLPRHRIVIVAKKP